MSFTPIDCEQRSEAWRKARCGRLTGSCAKAILAKTKKGEEAYTRRDLCLRLALERLTGQPQEGTYTTAEMQRGIDLEPAAIGAYEVCTGNLVQITGFLAHDSLPVGCSLDGHVGDFETLVSIKCPKATTHLRYLRDGKMPEDYVGQMLHEFWVTGAKFYDFVSYDDRFPPALQLFRVRVLRNEDDVREYERKALAFLRDVDTEYNAVLTMTDLRGQLERAAVETA